MQCVFRKRSEVFNIIAFGVHQINSGIEQFHRKNRFVLSDLNWLRGCTVAIFIGNCIVL